MNKQAFFTGQANTADKLYVASIFETIDGETNAFHAGTWSTFIRLQGCRVGCVYCDTKYSWPINKGGEMMSVQDIMNRLAPTSASKVTITGGEPMEQWGPAFQQLLRHLRLEGYHVSMETAGTEHLEPIVKVASFVNLIVDYKLPSAKAVRPMIMSNFSLLQGSDVVKLVATLADMKTLPGIVRDLRHNYGCRARFVFSPVWQQSSELTQFLQLARYNEFPKWNIGLNLQMHKFIWPDNVRDEEGALMHVTV